MKTTTTGLILFAILFLAGCGRDSERPAEAVWGPPVPVSVEEALYKSLPHTEAVPGQVKAAHTAVVSARVQGEVGRMLAAAGQQVRQGEILAELVSDELGARLRRAEAEFEAASLELERVSSLLGSHAATPRELESAEVRHRSTQAAVEEAETFFGYTTVRAPFDGIVTRKHIEAGDLVSPGQPIIALFSPELYRLETRVPESLIALLSVGSEMAFEIDSAHLSGSGVLSELEPVADPLTRTVLVKVDLPDSPALRSGQYGRMLLPAGETRRLTVPEGSVLKRGQLEYVFVVSNDRARLRLIRTGMLQEGRIEVISGLNEGESIVTDVPSGLRDGQPVEVQG